MRFTDIKLQTRKDKELILALENNIRNVISSVMGVSDENKKILYIDANILYGYAMSESLLYDEFKND